MKKLILLALVAIMMAGCDLKRNSDGSIALSEEAGISINPVERTIDSCEYISWGHGLAHKGNCRFCKERREKELEELVGRLKK